MPRRGDTLQLPFPEVDEGEWLVILGSFSHYPGSGLAEILGVLQLNVCAKRLMEHITGFLLSTRSIGDGVLATNPAIARKRSNI